jgi:hypothetical protein
VTVAIRSVSGYEALERWAAARNEAGRLVGGLEAGWRTHRGVGEARVQA